MLSSLPETSFSLMLIPTLEGCCQMGPGRYFLPAIKHNWHHVTNIEQSEPYQIYKILPICIFSTSSYKCLDMSSLPTTLFPMNTKCSLRAINMLIRFQIVDFEEKQRTYSFCFLSFSGFFLIDLYIFESLTWLIYKISNLFWIN